MFQLKNTEKVVAFVGLDLVAAQYLPIRAPSLTSNFGSPRGVPSEPQCVDNHRRCKAWAKDGGCVINWGFMATQCRKVCGLCDSQGQTALYNAEKKLRTRIMADYDVSTRPLKNDSDTIDVALSFSLLHLMNVDEEKQTVMVQGYLKIKWYDSRLEWPPSDHQEITRLSLASSVIWHPALTVVNTGDAGNSFLLRGNPTPIMVSNNGIAVWTPRVEATSLCNFDVRYFPADRHHCSITFGPWMQDGNLINMTLWEIDDDGDIDNPYLLPNQKWKVTTKLRADDDYHSPCCSEQWPVVHIDLDIQRYAPMISAAIITPVVYVMVTLLLCFVLPIRSAIRFLFSGGDCVILIFLLLHLSGVMPEAASSTPVIIQITVALLLESLLVMLCCGFLYHLSSPRCQVHLTLSSPGLLKTLSKLTPTIKKRPSSTDATYIRFHETQPDLVDMFFGNDQSTLLSNHADDEAKGKPVFVPTGNGTTNVTATNGNGLANETNVIDNVDGGRSVKPVSHASMNRQLAILINRIALLAFIFMFVIQLLVVFFV
ncbi:putative Neuronal acetylcholine receptor subunit alpha-5 [Hypsibius exemplaris]|uniref:Neuronal acetylcholine receptor subunit alpha-5 n=1 Tax=Hypsibius exemplaris TaxID=2072580 RepID=A0A1W0X0E4_HYPEX|nr:putative Neuronal acetylcholine receptor subunit alpha-5 [Hypsibius exemplaris]